MIEICDQCGCEIHEDDELVERGSEILCVDCGYGSRSHYADEDARAERSQMGITY
jgi:hypothetical protein